MMDAAAGFATAGKIPFASHFRLFNDPAGGGTDQKLDRLSKSKCEGMRGIRRTLRFFRRRLSPVYIRSGNHEGYAEYDRDRRLR